jgi:HNH endonuclease
MQHQRTPDCRELLVRMLARTHQEGECIVWDGAKISQGYGNLRVPVIFGPSIGGKVTKTHRLVWHLHHGPIPDDMHVLHHCDNPPCINIGHLFLGTNADNKRDSIDKRRHAHHENHGKTKLTWEQVNTIRSLFEAGTVKHGDLTRIASDFGVGKTAIRAIRDGINWRQLT